MKLSIRHNLCLYIPILTSFLIIHSKRYVIFLLWRELGGKKIGKCKICICA